MNRENAALIGDRLRGARQQSRRTQKDAAGECQVSRQAVSGWERGESVPTVAELMALAMLYGESTDYLLFGVKTVPLSSAPVISAILDRPPAPGGQNIRPVTILDGDSKP